MCKTYLWDWGRQRRSELILWSARDWGLVEPVRQLLSEPVCGVIKQLTLQHMRSVFTCVCEEQRELREYKINPVKVLISRDLLSLVAACLWGRHVSVYWCLWLWEHLMCPTCCIRPGRDANAVWFCIRYICFIRFAFYISLLIIPCIIYYVTNKETLNLTWWVCYKLCVNVSS